MSTVPTAALDQLMKRLLLQLLVTAGLIGGAVYGWYVWQPVSDSAPSAAGPGGPPPTPVDITHARLEALQDRLEAVGTARARESIEVVAQLAGRIAAIHFHEGQQVETGQVLVELDSAREQAELREANAQLAESRRQLNRARTMLQSNTVSQAQVDELSATVDAAEARSAVIQVRLQNHVIVAPFEGVVGLRDVSLGAFVEPNRRITTLDDISTLRIDFSVPERFLDRLTLGLGVLATSAAFPEHPFAGEINRIDTRIDPTTRAIRVQAEFPNENGRLRPGMFLRVELTLSERQAVVVPEEAVVSEGERHYVFRVADNRVERQQVQLGQRRRGEVEIRSGLAAAESVVIAGVHRLRDGAAIRIRNEQPMPSSNAQ